MTNCNEALTELYGYLDGELTSDRRQHIEQHLNDCSPCLEAFDFNAEIRMVIAQKCRDHVPEALRQKIAEAIRLDASSP
ncbi:MAG: mycothiol system anti-sigma-R factor [Acidimicrobiales bacterium]